MSDAHAKVVAQFHDAVDEAFNAGWNAAMEAQAEAKGTDYTRGFLEQLIYQETIPFSADILAREGAQRASKAIVRNCEVKIIDRDLEEG